MAFSTWSTDAMASASRGERAARIETDRISCTSSDRRSSSSLTSSAMSGSSKYSVAYARSIMSSEVSFASESMVLRFLGRSSMARQRQCTPTTTMARMSANAPTRSIEEVIRGMPWLSGSRPSRYVAMAP